MTNDLFTRLETAKDEGYRPRVVAQMASGKEVTIISFPFTDGEEVKVLVRPNPENPEEWCECCIGDLTLNSEKNPS